MFIGDEVLLDLGFIAASDRLANLTTGSTLLSASRAVYDETIAGLGQTGPLSSVPGPSRLARAQFRDLTKTSYSVRVALRWEAAGPGGALFPVLDGDITLTAVGDQAALLELVGVYRPPLGLPGAELDRRLLHRVADTTIRAFLSRLAEAIVIPVSAAEPELEIPDPEPSSLPPAFKTP
jgi:hypothetical protein